MTAITLGTLVDGGPLRIEIATLVDSRALITGNSGAGKSRLLRRLIEQTFGKVQIIVIDPEGEFPTLREKHAFLLAGRGGEMPAEPRAAALMARRLMELRASAILDLYDLKLPQRRDFVKAFLESLMELPRDQYRPVLVIIDEAQTFCPERGAGEASSTDAVIALMTQGRKRGLCGIPATLRLSMLDKSAAAQANNVFVGRTTLDVDQKRAAAALGISNLSERTALRDIPAGIFLAYGPALSKTGVVRFQGGDVATTHPKAGQRHTAVTTPAPDAVRKIAAELADLPAQAEEEIRTLQAAKARVRDLEAELRKKPAAPAAPAPKTVEKAVLKDAQIKRLEAATERLLAEAARTVDVLAQRQQVVVTEVVMLRDALKAVTAAQQGGRHEETLSPPAGRAPGSGARPAATVARAPVAARVTTRVNANAVDGQLGKCERAILAVLALNPDGCVSGKLTLLSGYRWTGGFRNSLSTLRALGYLEGDNGGVMQITHTGADAIRGQYDPLPQGKELIKYWLENPKLGKCEREILAQLVDVWPNGISAETLLEKTNYKWTGGFRNSLSTLRTAGLLVGKNTETMKLADDLGEAGGLAA